MTQSVKKGIPTL
ncbi:Acyl-CoA dehydrogenase, partial [Pseudomonas amygdali pv. eriobotryae]